ncbi:MAG: riboflavin biosynthesis protein RibF [Ruminococcaceae bacterium]|nr:riboflavin biosynthesis protein RibF [Oscillospiraceae bacterium]
MPIIDLHTHSDVAALPKGSVIVLGYFDGVHLGHRALFDEAKKLAAERGVPVCVWTFEKSWKDENTANELTANFEKSTLFAECNIDYEIIESFEDLKDIDGATFFEDSIARKHAPSAVVCGFNFTFGKGAACTADDLGKMAESHGIAYRIVPEQRIEGERVSSSRIRRLIKDGCVEEANLLLASPYSITSIIEHGVQIGRKMGIRTINQRLPRGKVQPKNGVYCCSVTLYKNGGENIYGGVCNIGHRPTVNDNQSDVTIETHIFDFDGEIYGKCATVKLYAMLREEIKFDDIDSLRSAIEQDATRAKELLKNIL